MRCIRRLVTITAASSLACLGLVSGPVSHAFAATGCDDGAGNEWMEVPIFRAPIPLAAEIGDGGTPTNVHVGLCYGTNSEAQNTAGQPEVVGGATFIDVLNPASNDGFPTGVN